MADRQYLAFWLLDRAPGLTISTAIAGTVFLAEWVGPEGHVSNPEPPCVPRLEP